MNTLASRRYIRPNPDPNPPPIFENPNLIPRILRQESSPSPRPFFRSHSCPMELLFLEDLSFDEYFGLSLFRTTSDNELLDIVTDPEFTKELEIQQANSISNLNIQNSPQSSLMTDQIPELYDLASTYFASPSFPHISENHLSSPFIPSLPHQPIITPQISITSDTSTTLVVINPPLSQDQFQIHLKSRLPDMHLSFCLRNWMICPPITKIRYLCSMPLKLSQRNSMLIG